MSSTLVTLIWELALILLVDGVWLFSSLCLIWGRIVELFLPGPISPHWGVLSKCLAYSKAASDPFVYSLLRHQYRKTCSLLANKVLKRSPLNSSSLRMENNGGRSNGNSSAINNTQPQTNNTQPQTNNTQPQTNNTQPQTNNIHPTTNKPVGQWRSSLSETIQVLYHARRHDRSLCDGATSELNKLVSWLRVEVQGWQCSILFWSSTASHQKDPLHLSQPACGTHSFLQMT